MMLSSSRVLCHQGRILTRQSTRRITTSSKSTSLSIAIAAYTTATASILLYNLHSSHDVTNSSHNNYRAAQCSAPLGGEAVMLSPKTEPVTGILFPRLCNGMTLAGCGVRVKWGFVKVCLIHVKYDESEERYELQICCWIIYHCTNNIELYGAGVCSRNVHGFTCHECHQVSRREGSEEGFVGSKLS